MKNLYEIIKNEYLKKEINQDFEGFIIQFPTICKHGKNYKDINVLTTVANDIETYGLDESIIQIEARFKEFYAPTRKRSNAKIEISTGQSK